MGNASVSAAVGVTGMDRLDAGLREQLPEAEEWLARLAEEEPENAGAYRVLAAVLRVQAAVEEEALERLQVAGLLEEIRRAARRASVQRRPVLQLLGGLPEPLLDEEWLREKLLQLLEELRSAGYDLRGAAADAAEPVEKALFSVRGMVEELLQGREDTVNAWAGAVSLPRDRVRAVALWLLQPLLRSLRRAAGASALAWLRDYWQQGVCPICGAPTRLARLAGEGRRQHLICQLCGMEWVFPRAKCPFCGAEEPGTVAFSTPLPDRPWLRLYRCRRCGAYWKAVDEEHPEAARKGLPPRTLYDVYTYPLDYIAWKLAEDRREATR